MIISIRVSPRSSQKKITVLSDGIYKVHLTASPVNGKANDSLVEMLAAHFGVGKTKIKIVRGGTSKNKVIEIFT